MTVMTCSEDKERIAFINENNTSLSYSYQPQIMPASIMLHTTYCAVYSTLKVFNGRVKNTEIETQVKCLLFLQANTITNKVEPRVQARVLKLMILWSGVAFVAILVLGWFPWQLHSFNIILVLHTHGGSSASSRVFFF